MNSQFRTYVANINRIRLAELIDHYETQGRIARARPSLIANPLSGELYRPRKAEKAATAHA